MEKKEFKVGEVFTCGLVKLKCVKSKEKGRCTGCFFLDCANCDTEIIGNCIAALREDKTNVMFVKVEE